MKVLLISMDDNLKDKLDITGHFNEVQLNQNIDLDNQNIKVLIVSDKIINPNQLQLLHYEKQLKQIPHIFYMLSNDYDRQEMNNIIVALKSKNIIIIPPRLTIYQIVERIVQAIHPQIDQKSKVITFLGADSKVGTTMVAQGVAEMLAKYSDKKVGLLFLNDSPNDQYNPQKQNVGIDIIKAKILNTILTPPELLEACISFSNVYILPGVNYMLDFRHYHPKHIEHLIKVANELFDVVIIDVGSKIDNGLSIAALNSTSFKYLVTTQQENARKQFIRTNLQYFEYLGLNIKDFMLVINKYIEGSELYDARELVEVYNMVLAGYIPCLSVHSSWKAELENKHLLHLNDEKYNNQVSKLSKIIATQLKIDYKDDFSEERPKEKGLIKKLLGYGGYSYGS